MTEGSTLRGGANLRDKDRRPLTCLPHRVLGAMRPSVMSLCCFLLAAFPNVGRAMRGALVSLRPSSEARSPSVGSREKRVLPAHWCSLKERVTVTSGSRGSDRHGGSLRAGKRGARPAGCGRPPARVPEKCSVTQIRSSAPLADSRIHVPKVSATSSTCVAFPMDVITDSITRGGRENHAPAHCDGKASRF